MYFEFIIYYIYLLRIVKFSYFEIMTIELQKITKFKPFIFKTVKKFKMISYFYR